jgi:hypothetical protein
MNQETVSSAISNVPAKTISQLMEEAKWKIAQEAMPSGDTFKDLSTVIVIPTRGTQEEKKNMNCSKCGEKNEYLSTTISGLHYVFVEAYKRLIRPMNVPIVELIIPGMEVGAAYNSAINGILSNAALVGFKYVLTIEDDNIIPFIPSTQGPLMMLYESMEKGFDVVGGLYWTKGEPSMPLIYGDPEESSDSKAGMFKVRFDWKEKPEGPIECNGMGMGFTLFKTEIFKDKRLEQPFFKTVTENTEDSAKLYTQDLYFFEKIRKLGYRVAVDTRIKVGHLDVKTGVIY